MKFTAPAKINLNLRITGRRESDGYHLLDSNMVFTRWGDEIIITPSNEFTLTADGAYANVFTGELLSTNRGAPNLIVKAVYMIADKANRTPDIHVHITKNIPSGAGLGGGSSDAAAVMHALNDIWDLGLSINELCAMGLELGAEIPVCLHAKPSRVTGIGDVIEPIEISPLNLLITWPDTPLLTKDVFDVYRQNPQIGSEGVNHLADAAISLCPEIKDLIDKLHHSEGCQSASMSGSGSACYGIFETIQQAEIACAQFKNGVTTRTLI